VARSTLLLRSVAWLGLPMEMRTATGSWVDKTPRLHAKMWSYIHRNLEEEGLVKMRPGRVVSRIPLAQWLLFLGCALLFCSCSKGAVVIGAKTPGCQDFIGLRSNATRLAQAGDFLTDAAKARGSGNLSSASIEMESAATLLDTVADRFGWADSTAGAFRVASSRLRSAAKQTASGQLAEGDKDLAIGAAQLGLATKKLEPELHACLARLKFVVTVEGLNLRGGPGIEQSIRQTMHAGDTVQLLGDMSEGWVRVRALRQGLGDGWVWTESLRIVEAPQNSQHDDSRRPEIRRAVVVALVALFAGAWIVGLFAMRRSKWSLISSRKRHQPVLRPSNAQSRPIAAAPTITSLAEWERHFRLYDDAHLVNLVADPERVIETEAGRQALALELQRRGLSKVRDVFLDENINPTQVRNDQSSPAQANCRC
jgi:hypothetical protein